MKKVIVYILILFFLGVSWGFAQDNPKETELLFMAKKAYEDGFYEVSLGMLERLFKDFNGSAQIKEARLLNGQCYFQQGRYLEALNIFEELLNDPECASFKDAIYFWMAEVHFKGNNFQQAAALYRKLIDEFPLSSYAAPAYYSLGWSLSQVGKYEQALQVFKGLLGRFPDEPQSKDAAFKLIECLYNLKRYAELENKVKGILKLYNNDALRLPYLYFYLAESEYYLDNFIQAAKDYFLSAQAFKGQKIGSLAKLGLGWSYLKLNKYKEAEEIFSDIPEINLDKKSLDILILARAVLMNQTNRVYEAKKLYEQLIKVSSDPLMRAQAYLGKADALLNLAEYGQAAQVYQEGLANVDKSVVGEELIQRMRYNLALADIKGGHISSGISMLEDILAESKGQSANVNILFQIGDAYKEQSEFGKAEEIYIKILKLYPDSTYADYAQYQLGSLRLQKNDYAGAIIFFNSILKNYPQTKLLADTLYSLGTAYFQNADYANSLGVFTRFQNEFKGNALCSQVSYMLASALLNLGKINEALATFKEAIKLYPQDSELRQKAEYEIANCYEKLGQENEALKQFKILRTKYPNSKLTADIMWWLGQHYYRTNDLVLARRYFSSLVNDFPDSRLLAEAFYALGQISAAEEKYEEAADNFKKALENPNVANAAAIRFKLAEALEANSEFEAAIQQYLLAGGSISQDTHSSVVAFLRAAKLSEDKENFKEALEIYKKVVRKNTPEAKFAQERIDWIGINVRN